MPASRGELFAGVTVAIVTPFAGGDIDWPGLAELIEWHVEQGTNALAPCGTTGETRLNGNGGSGSVVSGGIAGETRLWLLL